MKLFIIETKVKSYLSTRKYISVGIDKSQAKRNLISACSSYNQRYEEISKITAIDDLAIRVI